ncbi:MAG: TIGR03016 family PEP-CTERM system-associated outer membrane protein [Sutterellaceae bacterium]|nr:TIGR03016 family PEP-CTERM system-associated outer membrane protein [Burkholderiaceae bacterium]MCX7902241.1 TIGR03016 family PEP-CTERM system-associated outer membrane protein [Burkholderiaceae bacterium]MDW8429323.1 TIGR03016 family PEP-CTERM system-associated outer membrane protein [Sutterellaceae bacterium]
MAPTDTRLIQRPNRNRRHARRWKGPLRRWVAAAFLASYGGWAAAARWSVEAGADARVTWTDNAAFDARGAATEDWLWELSPVVRLLAVGPRLRLAGTAGVSALTYTQGAGRSRVLSTADIRAEAELAERHFFLEAAVVARPGAENVFAPRSDGPSDVNTVTSVQYRLTPTWRGRLGGAVDVQLRSANAWTDIVGERGAPADAAYTGEHSLRLRRMPVPFGWTVEVVRSETRYESVVPPAATTDTGRVELEYAWTPGLTTSLRAGHEKTNLVIRDRQQATYGVAARWRPTERTLLEASGERRFFGTGWSARFDHRWPRVAWSFVSRRDVGSFPQAFLNLPPTENVVALLNAAFTTRFPDEFERNRVIADIIARYNLPASLAAPTALYSRRFSIQTSHTASLAVIGVRNSLALSLFHTKTEDLADAAFLVPSATATNVLQQGEAATLAHLLTPLTTVNLTLSRTRTEGVGADAGPQSRQIAARLELAQRFAPRSRGYVGARWQKFESTAGAAVPADAAERAVFLGIAHRF